MGSLWLGGDALPVLDGAVLVDASGKVIAAGPAASIDAPVGVRGIGGPGSWIGPGMVHAHVHLAFGTPAEALRGGLVGVRDLGAPTTRALDWQTRTPRQGATDVSVAGPLLTAPGGYPSKGWGAQGFAAFVDSPAAARQILESLARDGVDLVKVALEPSAGDVPTLGQLRAVVDAAHAAGLAVTAHALNRDMVHLALDAGVDELAHTPTQRLRPADIERLAKSGIPVVSTIETHYSGTPTSPVLINAAAFVAAGIPLIYGTDLGNAGTSPGVDGRELQRLADAGLGWFGALRAATQGSGRAAGMRNHPGVIAVGAPAELLLLPADPQQDKKSWSRATAMYVAGRVVTQPG
ncbi:MAG: amidohydrolase family protein [Mycobacteriales bacterium]